MMYFLRLKLFLNRAKTGEINGFNRDGMID